MMIANLYSEIFYNQLRMTITTGWMYYDDLSSRLIDIASTRSAVEAVKKVYKGLVTNHSVQICTRWGFN